MSRSILNLLEAHCDCNNIEKSIVVESLRFCNTESNRDIEADILQGDRGAISMGEEIHEEERWWIGHLVLLVPVDYVRCRRNNNLFFCSFPTTWLTSCNEWIETIDTNKTARSYEVHSVIPSQGSSSRGFLIDARQSAFFFRQKLRLFGRSWTQWLVDGLLLRYYNLGSNCSHLLMCGSWCRCYLSSNFLAWNRHSPEQQCAWDRRWVFSVLSSHSRQASISRLLASLRLCVGHPQ